MQYIDQLSPFLYSFYHKHVSQTVNCILIYHITLNIWTPLIIDKNNKTPYPDIKPYISSIYRLIILGLSLIKQIPEQ